LLNPRLISDKIEITIICGGPLPSSEETLSAHQSKWKPQRSWASQGKVSSRSGSQKAASAISPQPHDGAIKENKTQAILEEQT
jgi:hypothetical protein